MVSETKTYKGRPCRYGHDGTRFRSNSHCIECAKREKRMYLKRNPEKVRAQNKRAHVRLKERRKRMEAELVQLRAELSAIKGNEMELTAKQISELRAVLEPLGLKVTEPPKPKAVTPSR